MLRDEAAQIGVFGERDLLTSLYQLVTMAVILPPFLGGGVAMVLAGFYPFPEMYTVFLDFPALYLLSALVLSLLAVKPFHRRLVALARANGTSSSQQITRLLHCGMAALLCGITLYSVLGAFTADISLERNGHATFELRDHLLSQLGIVSVVLLCALPILSFYINRIGRFLAPRGMALGAFSLKARVYVFGIVSPLLVDTLLLGYFYNAAGIFSLRTLALWLSLVCVSAVGAYLFWRSLEQGLFPLTQFTSRNGGKGAEGYTPVVPLSLDELGQLSWRLNSLEARQHQLLSDLRQQEAHLIEAERIARIGRWRSEVGGRLVWSEQVLDICGVAASDFPGTNEFFYGLVHPDDRPNVREAVDTALESGSEYAVIHRLVRPDGRVLTVFEKAEVERDAQGRATALLGIIQDISETVEVEEKLRQAQKMEAIGNLTGGVAHDFNNILAVILGNLELIRETTDDEETWERIEGAIEATQRGAELTRNMLSFARRARLQPTLLDLNQLVRDTKNWSARVLPETIAVETSLLAGLWQVEADPNSAQTALLNLILNARDAMPDGGNMTIETGNIRIDDAYIGMRQEDISPGRYVMLAVSDTGAGIDPQLLEHIFEPFYTTKPPGKGSGLGLSMIQGFMTQSGGTVRVYSEPGVGTTFKLYFPAVTAAADADADADAQVVQPGRSMQSSGAKVFVVEDEPAVLDVLIATLANAGYNIRSARSGDEALRAMIADPSVDVLITDIVMPGTLQGTHLARELRKRWPAIPVVFMSGYASEATVHGNGLRPEDTRLTKPVSRADLIAAIEKALASRATG